MTTYYAVIDTNVILSALLSKKDDTATVQVIEAVLKGKITPLHHRDIITEYDDVLNRPEFKLNAKAVSYILTAIKQYGIEVVPKQTGEVLVHMDDLIFYEVTMGKREYDAFLVTGNKKHYPVKDFIVSPSEMMQILNGSFIDI